jgi:hypothetical protein
VRDNELSTPVSCRIQIGLTETKWAAVRTSQIAWPSAKGHDDLSREGERYRFDEFSFIFYKDAAMMRGQRGHDSHLMFFKTEKYAGTFANS